MTDQFNLSDEPIQTPEDDQFGIDPFARSLAHSIRSMNSPRGATIAINGAWGSGKSSAVNLIRYHLKSALDSGELQIIDFKCWWFRGEEALTLAFLQELNSALTKSVGQKTREIVPKLGRTLLQAGPVVGPAINLASGGLFGALSSGSMDFTKRFFPEGESVEDLFNQLSSVLTQQNRRFLIVIDDIDRLTPQEALAVFRLVRSVGRLPNVIYILVFDRELAEKAVQEHYPSEGPHFLEKIIQASFEAPLPPRDDLNAAVLSEVESRCGPPKSGEEAQYFMNIFYDAVAPYVKSPRDVTRISNAISISWTPIANEVNVANFVALEVMRLNEGKLYNAIRTAKDRVCGPHSEGPRNNQTEEEIQGFIECASENNREHARAALLRLFPRFENVVYSSDTVSAWEAQRLVCTEKHFDTYFRMSIGDETISITEVDELIDRCDEANFVKDIFLKALATIRRSGKSKVPLLFDELIAHARRINHDKILPLVSVIFEIADNIDRDEDRERGAWSVGDNHLRIHWLVRRLTFQRTTLEERSLMFLSACRGAGVGWITDFASSAIDCHYPRREREPFPEEKCLVSEEGLPELKSIALKKIKEAAASGQLISHPRLPNILYRWMEFAADDSASVKSWTDGQLLDDIAVAQMAKAFTGESWSYGLGMFSGLGDRVAKRSTIASIDGLESIMDVEKFRGRLEELEKSNVLESPHKEQIQTFLDAWRSREAGED